MFQLVYVSVELQAVMVQIKSSVIFKTNTVTSSKPDVQISFAG